MQYTVYADVLFLVNWVMDYVLLWSVCVVMGLPRKKMRLGSAAALGAGWVCVIAIFSLPPMLEGILTWLGISSLMVWIACCPRKFCDLLNRLVVLYLVAFLAGGGLNLLYFHTSAGTYLKQVILGIQMINASGVGVILGSIAMILAVTKVLNMIEKQKKRNKNQKMGLLSLFLQFLTVLFMGFSICSVLGIVIRCIFNGFDDFLLKIILRQGIRSICNFLVVNTNATSLDKTLCFAL